MEIINLDMTPSTVTPNAHAGQYDASRTVRFMLKNGGVPFTLAGTETITAEITRSDNTEVTVNVANTSSNYVDVVFDDTVCTVKGLYACELRLKDSDGFDIGSKNFALLVQRDPYDGAGVVVETVGPADICTFETTLAEPLQSVLVNIESTQSGSGTPYPPGGGKNKFDKATVNHGCLINGAGNYVSYPDNNVSDYTPVVEGVGYYLYGLTKHPNTNQDNFELFDSSKTKVGYANVRTNEYPYTIPSGVKFVRFTVHDDDLNTAMFATSEGEYEPYSNICPINGYTEANITRCGVNLFDKTDIADGYIDDTTGAVSGGAYYKHTNYIPVVGGQKIYIMTEQITARWGAWYDKDKNYISGITNYSQTEATAPNNACFIRLTCKTTDTGNLDTFAVNYPSTPTYHSYTGNTYTANFGQTVYGGVLDVTRGKLHVTHKEVDLGSLDYVYSSSLERFNTSNAIDNIVTPVNDNTAANILSDIYATKAVNVIMVGYEDNAIGLSTNKKFYIRNSTYTDPNAFKTAMSGKVVVYELATPFDIDLTPEVISAVVGTNNVFADCGQTTVKYLKAGA